LQSSSTCHAHRSHTDRSQLPRRRQQPRAQRLLILKREHPLPPPAREAEPRSFKRLPEPRDRTGWSRARGVTALEAITQFDHPPYQSQLPRRRQQPRVQRLLILKQGHPLPPPAREAETRSFRRLPEPRDRTGWSCARGVAEQLDMSCPSVSCRWVSATAITPTIAGSALANASASCCPGHASVWCPATA
jgi:hypothetical protein